MNAGRFDSFARMLARSGSRRRLFGVGIGGAATALGARRRLARAQTCTVALGDGCETTEQCCDAVSCCGGVCLDLAAFLTSSENCGRCGVRCDDGGTCDNGVCRPIGALDCGAGEVDTLTDASNCGGCGVRCASGFCQGGDCVPCPGGSTDCGGFCADLSTDDANCGSCGVVCDSGWECSNSGCHLKPCAFGFDPCPPPDLCCPHVDPCEGCPIGSCTGTECIEFVVEDRATCAAAGANGVVTRDVGVASADGLLTLVARTTTERDGAGYGEKGRVRLALSINEGRTPQVRIDAVATCDHGVSLTAEYGPAFAGVRNLTFRSEPGEAPALDIDNRGAGAIPALSVDPVFVAAADDLAAALAGDLDACFAGGAEASPVAGSPDPDDEATCQSCRETCANAFGLCYPQAGVAACASDPNACTGAIVACTDTYCQCLDACAGGGSC